MDPLICLKLEDFDTLNAILAQRAWSKNGTQKLPVATADYNYTHVSVHTPVKHHTVGHEKISVYL